VTHFLLPVGESMTLTHKLHIHLINLQLTHSWSWIKISQCRSYNILPVFLFSP